MNQTREQPFFMHLFTWALLLTSVLSVFLGWHILDSYSDSRTMQSRDIRLLDLGWTVFHREETLARAAHMVSSTGELRWESEYRKFEPTVRASLGEMAGLELRAGEREAVTAVLEAHDQLARMESEVFDLARRAERQAAQGILSSSEYQDMQQTFVDSIDRLMASVRGNMDAVLAHQSTQAHLASIAVAVTLPLLIVSWLFVLYTTRRYMRERNQAESSLELSEKMYRELVESANSIILSLDARGRITFLNRYGLQFFGYTEEELYGRSLIGTLVPEIDSSGRDLAARTEELLGNPEGFESHENENVRRNGERVWVTWTNRAIVDEEGNVAGVLSIGNDISARKRAEEALQLDEARFEALFALSQMTDRSNREIVDFALDRQVELTSSEIGFLGFMNEDETVLILQGWSEQVMERCRVKDQPVHFPVEGAGLWAEAIRQRQPIVINDYHAPHPGKRGYPEGHMPLSRFMCVPVLEGSRIVAVAAVANKPTDYDASDVRQLTLFLDGVWKLVERRRAETALREAENLAAMGRALSCAAHDIKTPLIAIGGFSRLVRNHLPEGSPDGGKLDIVIRETERLESMVKDMLDFSKPLELRRSMEDITRIIEESLTMVDHAAREKRVKVERSASRRAIGAPVDAMRMKQVVVNLVMNALQASPEGETVVVRTPNGGPNVVIEVTDHGPGIPRDKRQEVFSPFYTTKQGGTGLGLSIVKKIVEAHRGNIAILDNPDRGITFRVEIPAGDGEEMERS